jgi:lipopolysaccharide export system protein LptA
VIADTIVTSERGTRLQAEGRVEATLLPDPAGRGNRTPTALFEGRETIHFVAGRLEAEDAGKVLRFRNNVRGWQADRNLSAEEVDVDTRSDALDARRRVSTRFPRATRSTPVGGFLQVTADALRYRGGDALATYSGSVRARQNEGWIECGRLEVATAKAGGAIQEVRGFDGVRFEFNAPPGSSTAAPEPVTGGADRLLYTPDAGWVRLFGDQAPAEVRRGGADGGTTAGRVLRYALETGRIEVESGTPSRAAPAEEDP